MLGFGAPGDSQAPHITADTAITASNGGLAVGHADQVAYVRARRLRVLLVVVPVVVAGGTIMAVMPHSSPSPGPERPSQSPSSSESPSPSRSSSAARSPSSGPAARPSGSSPARAQPVQTGAGGIPAAGPSPSAKPKATALSPGSVSRLRNVSTDQCVSGDGSVYPGFGTCSSSDAYAWTLLSSSGDTFKLVNRASGNCLSAPYSDGYAAGLGSCSGFGGTGYVLWRIGSTTAAGQTLKNTETGQCLAIASPSYGGGKQVMVTTCNSDQPEQLWRNGGSA